MQELYEFLNQQSDERLVGYLVMFGVTVYFVMQGLVYIVGEIFNRKK